MAINSNNADTSPNLGFEARLWTITAATSSNIRVTDYKHVVLGLIFLKCCAANGEWATGV